MTTTEKKTGTCPKCQGSGRRPVPDETRKYLKYNERWDTWSVSGYDADTDSIPCNNCGGQTMSMRGTGEVPLRPDGTPCLHDYAYLLAGNCYHRYTCKHGCGHVYHIDSGD